MNNLYRSSDEKVIAGVCAGLARKFNLNLTGLRWALAIIAIFSGLPVLAYVVLWLVLQERPTRNTFDV